MIWGAMHDPSQHNRLCGPDRRTARRPASTQPHRSLTGSRGNVTGARTRRKPLRSTTSQIPQWTTMTLFLPFDRGSSRARRATAWKCRILRHFGNAFGRADGWPTVRRVRHLRSRGAAVRDARGFKMNASTIPASCVMPLTLDSAASGGDKDVDGFAFVYLTGCYDWTAPIVEPEPGRPKRTSVRALRPQPIRPRRMISASAWLVAVRAFALLPGRDTRGARPRFHNGRGNWQSVGFEQRQRTQFPAVYPDTRVVKPSAPPWVR